MKTQGFHKTGMTLVAATLMAVSAPNIFAQDTNASGQDQMPPPATATEPPPAPIAAPTTTTPLSSADNQILQLTQAKIGDSTIVTYIQNSGTVYGLDASQIVYMKQQGVSEAVINAMLNQRSAMAAAAQQAQQQQQAQAQAQAQTALPYDPNAVAQPSTPAPSTTIVVPDSQTYYYNSWAAPYWYYPNYYYYPYYNTWYYPGVYWGWGWRGGYWGGGYRGGFHGGGGFRGGFGGGGGFHGGGGGGFHGGGGGGGGFHGR